jgi:hypothetical protein
MKTEVTIIVCDRCGKDIHGVIIEAAEGLPKLTAGFYDVSEGAWHEFARGDYEKNVCDFCMWSDRNFTDKYPHNRKLPPV